MSSKVTRVVRSMKEARSLRPALPKRLFWDFRYYEIDWRPNYRTIIGRVLERGSDAEWLEMISFYGHDKVLHTLKAELTYLPDYIIPKVCDYFRLQPEELKCSHRPAWRRTGHWI